MPTTRRGAASMSASRGPDSGPGAAGKWSDAATGEHGDLLDLIGRRRHLSRVADAIGEARAFLALPRHDSADALPRRSSVPSGSAEAARRLFALGRPVPGTPAETYLRARGITARLDWPALRFHPSVWYRESEAHPREAWPALLAAVTDPAGAITGIQRSWLDRTGTAKAPIADPRRALGHLLGNGVRFGSASEPAPAQAGVVAAGEGVETMLALASVLPSLPLIAALSANHLAALAFAPSWRRLYVARDNDAAGRHAADTAARTRAGRRHRSPRARAGARGLQRRSLRPRPRRAPRASRSPARPRRSRPLRRRSVQPGIAVPVARDRAGRRKPVRAGGGQPFSREAEGRATAFPSGDLPEPPGGPKGAALIPGAMARRRIFRRRPERGPALHRETKCFRRRHPPRCFGPAGAPRLRPRPGIAVKAAMGAAEFPPAERHPP